MHSQSRFGTPSLPGSCLCLSGSLSGPVFLEKIKKIKKQFCPRTSEPGKNKRLSAERRGRRSYRAFPGAVAATPPRRFAASTPRIAAFEAIALRCALSVALVLLCAGLTASIPAPAAVGFLLCKLGPPTQKQTRVEKAAFGFIVFHKALVFRSHMWV